MGLPRLPTAWEDSDISSSDCSDPLDDDEFSEGEGSSGDNSITGGFPSGASCGEAGTDESLRELEDRERGKKEAMSAVVREGEDDVSLVCCGAGAGGPSATGGAGGGSEGAVVGIDASGGREEDESWDVRAVRDVGEREEALRDD